MTPRAEEPAFPTHSVWDNDKPEIGWIDGGLTKREYFAAMAMQGLLASRKEWVSDGRSNFEIAASLSLKYADALLAELNKEPANE